MCIRDRRWTLHVSAGGCIRGGSLREGSGCRVLLDPDLADFPFLWHSSARILSFALWPGLPHSPQLPHSSPTVAPNMSPNSAPNCFQTVSRLRPNCAQTVPRHAVARAIARVTGDAYRLTRLTRLSLACCQIFPDSPNTLLHVVRFPRFADTHLHASKPLPGLPDALLHAFRFPPESQRLSCMIQDQLRFPFHATTGLCVCVFVYICL